MNTKYLDYLIANSNIIEFKRLRAKTELAELTAELAAMQAVIEAARIQNSVWHSPAVTAALEKLDKVTK